MKETARCDVTVKTVKTNTKRYQLSKDVKDLKSRGGKIKTSPRENRWILRQVQANRGATTNEIKNGLVKLSGCSVSAVRRRLIRANKYCRRSI